ncbi:aminopeptidase N [Egibacter rhizosphaerae]|uniref:Aminopeptidase N n=1 Tax=Egibacter rhizosphaerae TaxID=1670831 RepID=A0A411YIA6_9ACTN|nr:aminopeptidase N [Egibacter rhizosphaerae]QBI20970.1 aminopeptidase N [Egibacter rhizosphaerae]
MHANLTREEARARAELVSDVAYVVELDLREGDDPAVPTFRTRTTVSFHARRPEAATFLDLDASELLAASLNGEPVPSDAYDGTRLHLDGLEERNVVEVTARAAYERSGVGLHRFFDPTDGAAYLHTQFEPFDANRVYACFDQPDLKAPFRLVVTAPPAWTVIGNQPPDGEPVPVDPVTPEAGRTWRFGATPPISTYLTAVCAGPFHAVHDTWRPSPEAREFGAQPVTLGLYARESLAPHLDTDALFDVTRRGLEWFTTAFRHPYPFADYEQLFVPEFNWGAMENPGCITFSEQFVFRSRVTDASRQARASTILHEMAHMWFGDLVTMRWWDDLWLNESFATYAGTRALAEATEFTDAWASFSVGTKAWAITQDQLPSTHPIAADIPDAESVRTHFDGITYAKGASVLVQLAAWVGDKAFFDGLAAYFSRHAWDNAELGDFLAALEEGSGRDLAAWSRTWLETSGIATLRPTVESDADGRYTHVQVHQEVPDAHPTRRPHRLALGCYDDDGQWITRRERIELDVDGAITDVPDLVGAARPDLLVPNDGDLTFAKLRLDETSLATLERGLPRIAEPLARAVCWGALWDLTRDAELPASRFVGLAADHAPSEGTIPLLQVVTRRVEHAIAAFVEPSRREDARQRMWAAAQAALGDAAPGSDAQLQWARVAAAVAADTEHREWVRGLLGGNVVIEGLEVDVDLRWYLLVALAAHGDVDEDRIDEEARRDPTDMGARRAAAARAARPDPTAKAHAWEQLTISDEPSLALRRAIAEGFWQPGQEALLAPFVTEYPETVAHAWRDRNVEEAITITTAAYPRTVVGTEAVETADAALARGDLPAPARRTVAEERDHTLRALRAREADATG